MGRSLRASVGAVGAALWAIAGPLPLQAQASPPQQADTLLYERLDLYDPVTGAFQGSEVTYWGPDGRRLRLEVLDADGEPSLLFYLRHDELGRESEGVYFESDPSEPRFERFAYSNDGRLKTTTYVLSKGGPGERTESDLDDLGREVFKRYFRADGTQYGEEEVLWNDDGTSAGWDFRYVGREGRAVYAYDYEAAEGGVWTRRVRLRNGEPQRVEVRTLWRSGEDEPFPRASRFETSPRSDTEGGR